MAINGVKATPMELVMLNSLLNIPGRQALQRLFQIPWVISGYQISIRIFVNSLVQHAAALQAALYHKWTYLNSHVLHAAVLFVSICKLVIGIKYINEYSDIRSLSIRISGALKLVFVAALVIP